MTLEKPKTVADVLEAAADLIEPEGRWAQDIFYKRGDCYCLVGALREAAGAGSAIAVERGPIADAVHAARGPDDRVMLHDWNDAPGRTQAEVVAKLREAASLSRQNEEKDNG